MKINKKVLYLFFIILIIILGIFFIYENMIKNSKIGNNMSSQEIVDNILNVNSYRSNVTIQVNSNKNKNKYILKQEYHTENGSIQEVIEPSNIAGTKIIKEGNKLTLENSSLNLSSIIENYQYISSNNLDLSSFIEDYKNDSRADYEENENEIKMYAVGDTNNNSNSKCKKTLYIDKKTNLPKQLEIEWTNKNNKVYILYNEVEIK